jgi:hypothetical protein
MRYTQTNQESGHATQKRPTHATNSTTTPPPSVNTYHVFPDRYNDAEVHLDAQFHALH